jgi:hypothetical protein
MTHFFVVKFSSSCANANPSWYNLPTLGRGFGKCQEPKGRVSTSSIVGTTPSSLEPEVVVM